MFGVMNHLSIAICENADEATRRGYIYSSDDYKPIEITKVVVVRNGTESGASSVDLVLQDQDGNKFVVMLTGKLLKSIPC